MFYNKLDNILDKCVPRRKLNRENSRYVYPEWYSGEIIKYIKIKANLHKKYKKSKRDCDYSEYAECRARVKKLIDIAHTEHKNKIQNRFVKDPKSFWQYIASKKSRINRQSIIKDGRNLTDEQCVVEFAGFFESVYNREPPKLDAQVAETRSRAGSARVHIGALSIKDVQTALMNLKPKRSSGPDGIPAFLFRDCARVLVSPLHHVFNICLQQSTFPDRWKITRVVPVPKDDLKLLLEVGDQSDCERLQGDIDRVVKWSQDNGLCFNVSKCSIISFTRARNPICYEYMAEATALQRVTQVRDLGVHLTPDLTFREHIVKICKKAYRNLGFVLRQSQGFTNITAIRVLYDALVRSHLEYGGVVWAPHEAKYSDMLERVQNKFARHLYWRLYGVYPLYPLMYPTLFVLGMVSYNELGVRRQFTLVVYLIKLLHGKQHNPGVLQLLSFSVPDRYVWRRRRPPLLAVPAAKTNLLAKTPLTRAIRTINQIQTVIDVFACQFNELAKIILYILCYRLE
ncbi:uncharacterized protein LOC111356245 [Spodoptera litura]|uniref:Uncharacterized protein LOC111356245 n=1 Tax=Spodoptera litura TaxID=69820 RepID=A0A9J7EE07_SPOLT|nr:uncharacterized protein LOC111356245 [Spodoptera litura]